MGLVSNLDISLSLDASAFNKANKDVANGIRETFGLTPKLSAAVGSLQTRLQKASEVFGLSAHEAELYRLKAQGVPPAALATAKALGTQIEAMEAARKKQDDLKKGLSGLVSKGLSKLGVPPELATGLSTATIGVAAVGAAALAAAGAFIYFGRQQLAAIDATGDLAKTLGVSVEGLTGLQFAAERLGSSGENVGGALEKLNKNLSEAAEDGGPAAAALDKLGLSARTLQGVPLDQAVKQISDQFVHLTSASDKAAVAQALFGKSGQDLKNFLDSGSAAMEEQIAKGRDLGRVLTDTDVEAAGAVNDAFSDLAGVFTGALNKAVVALAPGLVVLANVLVSVAQQAIVVTKWVASAAVTLAQLANHFLLPVAAATKLIEVVSNFTGLTQVLKGFGVQMDEAQQKFKDDAAAAAKARVSTVELTGSINKLENALNAELTAVGRTKEEVDLLKLSTAGATAEQLANATALTASLESRKAAVKSADELIKKTGDLSDKLSNTAGLDKYIVGLAAVKVEYDSLVKQLQNKSISEEQFKSQVIALTFKVEGLDKVAEKTKTLQEDITKLNDKYKEEIATVGLTSEQIDIYKLKVRGATDEQLALTNSLTASAHKAVSLEKAITDLKARGKDLGKELGKGPEFAELRQQLADVKADFADDPIVLKFQLDQVEKAKDIIAGLPKTALQKFQDQAKKIAAVKDQLSAKQYASALKQAYKDSGLGEVTQVKRSGALEVGSQEARSAVLNAYNQPRDIVGKNTTRMVKLLETIAKRKPAANQQEQEVGI